MLKIDKSGWFIIMINLFYWMNEHGMDDFVRA